MRDYDNFFLPVTDLNKAKKFYHRALGLPIKFDFSEKGMIAFQVGNQEPALIVKDIGKFSTATHSIWFAVDDVKKVYQELRRGGVEFLSEPFPIQTGLAVELKDPFGNRLGLTDYSNPKDTMVQDTKFRDETSSELFIVHGYDDAMTQDVAHVFTVLGFKPIILRDMPHKDRTVVEELVGAAEDSNASFAVILLSPEDMAYQKDEPHPRLRARPQARQNSIFELGYFTGKLGRENVVVIHKKEDFEMLSDYSGVTYIPYDSGKWRYSLVKELRARGYHVAADKLYE